MGTPQMSEMIAAVARMSNEIAAKDATIDELRREVERLKGVATDAAELMRKIDDTDSSRDGPETDRVFALYEFDSLRQSLDHVRTERSAYFDALMDARQRATTAERQLAAEKEAVRVLGSGVCAAHRILEHLNAYGDEEEVPDDLAVASDRATAAIRANPIASAAIKGEQA